MMNEIPAYFNKYIEITFSRQGDNRKKMYPGKRRFGIAEMGISGTIGNNSGKNII
jgi:hypothetical protein